MPPTRSVGRLRDGPIPAVPSVPAGFPPGVWWSLSISPGGTRAGATWRAGPRGRVPRQGGARAGDPARPCRHPSIATCGVWHCPFRACDADPSPQTPAWCAFGMPLFGGLLPNRLPGNECSALRRDGFSSPSVSRAADRAEPDTRALRAGARQGAVPGRSPPQAAKPLRPSSPRTLSAPEGCPGSRR